MPRQIEFRAYEIKSGLMLDWLMICQTAFNDPRQAKIDDYYGIMYNIFTDPEYRYRKMQFIGFLDKNKKKIFEGDILRSDVYSAEMSKHFEVFFKQDGYFVSSKRTKQNWKIGEEYRLTEWLKHLGKNQIEIIGNIYQNPELLEIKND